MSPDLTGEGWSIAHKESSQYTGQRPRGVFKHDRGLCGTSAQTTMRKAMKRAIAVILLASEMLAACTIQSEEGRKIENAKAIARATMKDPSSVLFDNMRYVPSTRSGCGALNAKNSYGGYVGIEP